MATHRENESIGQYSAALLFRRPFRRGSLKAFKDKFHADAFKAALSAFERIQKLPRF